MDSVQYIVDIWESIRAFLERGGPVILALSTVIFVMWALILERALYLWTDNRVLLKRSLSAWESRSDRESWQARAIYDANVSRLSLRMESGFPVIRALASLCPLLGLLGTVTGMIVIFDVMASIGSSSPRAFAGGIARATLPTMAGMVGALSGIFPVAILGRVASSQKESLQDGYLLSSQVGASFMPSLPRFARVGTAVTGSLFVTFGLILLMQTLIETGKEAIVDNRGIRIVDFIRVKRQERVETREEMPKKLTPEQKPESMARVLDMVVDEGSISVDMSELPEVQVTGFGVGATLGDFALSDAEYMPIVRVNPIYPSRAAEMGLEGWVIVSFTVTTAGTVRDVVIVESSHPIFNRNAVRAVEKFKYKPRMVDGEPVEVHGVQTKLTFMFDE